MLIVAQRILWQLLSLIHIYSKFNVSATKVAIAGLGEMFVQRKISTYTVLLSLRTVIRMHEIKLQGKDHPSINIDPLNIAVWRKGPA